MANDRFRPKDLAIFISGTPGSTKIGIKNATPTSTLRLSSGRNIATMTNGDILQQALREYPAYYASPQLDNIAQVYCSLLIELQI